MELKKNSSIELYISDTGVNGEGIGKFEGCTFFVKDALPGDTVRAVITKMKKTFGYAKMTEILRPSKSRIQAPCENARRCGGCQIMEMSYEEQLRLKENKVRSNLEKIGGLENLNFLPILGMEEKEPGMFLNRVPVRYRNKMQFPIGRDRDGKIAAGFYAGRTHAIINTEDCVIAPEVLSRILQTVKTFLESHKISVYNEQTGQGLVRHLVLRMGFRSGEIMVCLVLNGESLNDDTYTQNVDYDQEFVDKLLEEYPKIASICININRENTNVILGREIRCIYGRPYIFDEIVSEEGKKLQFKISPLSFYQVNPVQMERLYSKALEFAALSGNEEVWDLYCGTGTISLFLSQKAKKVFGVEIIPDAIHDAKENAERNGITNAEFFCGRSEEVFPEYVKLKRQALEQEDADEQDPTVVVLDPPRRGCDRKLLDSILEVGPKKIVYVSCDSATLARDLKILTEGAEGNAAYRVEKVQPVDMFPNSVHCEVVSLLQRMSNTREKG